MSRAKLAWHLGKRAPDALFGARSLLTVHNRTDSGCCKSLRNTVRSMEVLGDLPHGRLIMLRGQRLQSMAIGQRMQVCELSAQIEDLRRIVDPDHENHQGPNQGSTSPSRGPAAICRK